MKRKQEKELQLPCCASTHSSTASRASRASRLSCLAPRAPLGHVRLSTTCASQATCTSHHVPTDSSLPDSQTPHSVSTPEHVFPQNSTSAYSHTCSHTPLSHHSVKSSTLRALSHTSTPQHVLSALHPALFWARCNRVRQSGADTPPFPPLFPRFGNRQMMMRICCYSPRARFGGKPRRRHAASPSVPRGV